MTSQCSSLSIADLDALLVPADVDAQLSVKAQHLLHEGPVGVLRALESGLQERESVIVLRVRVPGPVQRVLVISSVRESNK